jgi:hypothetical protein
MSIIASPYQPPINREQLIQPFYQEFDQSASQLKKQFSITESLDIMFPEQKRQDKDVARAKETLGELAKEFSAKEIKEIVTDIDCLVANWLDDFERSIFEGKTLKELLHEKGGML